MPTFGMIDVFCLLELLFNIFIQYIEYISILNIYSIYMKELRIKLSSITAYIFRLIRQRSVMTNLKYLLGDTEVSLSRVIGMAWKDAKSSRPTNYKPGMSTTSASNWRLYWSHWICLFSYKTGELHFRNLSTLMFCIWLSKEQRTCNSRTCVSREIMENIWKKLKTY